METFYGLGMIAGPTVGGELFVVSLLLIYSKMAILLST